MAYYLMNASTFKIFLTRKHVYLDTLLHDFKHGRLFPDGKVFTRRITYGNTV